MQRLEFQRKYESEDSINEGIEDISLFESRYRDAWDQDCGSGRFIRCTENGYKVTFLISEPCRVCAHNHLGYDAILSVPPAC